MESFIEIKIKNLVKFSTRAVCISAKQKNIPNHPELMEDFMVKYKKVLEENKGCVVFLDTRGVDTVSFEMIWSKMAKFSQELDPVGRKNIRCTVLFISNKNFKLIANGILKIYPPVVPLKICSENSEGMAFVETVLSKK